MKLRSANHQLHLVRLYLAIIFLQLLYMQIHWAWVAVVECWGMVAVFAEIIAVDVCHRFDEWRHR